MNTSKIYLFFFVFIGLFCACSDDDNDSPAEKDYFTLWNSCEALNTLQEYVEDVTNPDSKNYITRKDRIATFDHI